MSCFEERSHKVAHTPATRDGSIDGFVRIKNTHIIIQAKRYKGSIAKKHVLDLHQLVKDDRKLDKGLFIHTGKSSAQILRYFRENDDMALISGVKDILCLLDGEETEIFELQIKTLKAK